MVMVSKGGRIDPKNEKSYHYSGTADYLRQVRAPAVRDSGHDVPERRAQATPSGGAIMPRGPKGQKRPRVTRTRRGHCVHYGRIFRKTRKS